MPAAEPHPPSRLRFKRPLPQVDSPKRRIRLGSRKTTIPVRLVPVAAAPLRQIGATERMMRSILARPKGAQPATGESLYDHLRSQAEDSKRRGALGRVAGNVWRDLRNLVRAGWSALRRKKPRKAPEAAPKKAERSVARRSLMGELLRMAVVGGATFGVAMLVMNWTAYASIAEFYYARVTGTNVEAQQQLERMVQPLSEPSVAAAEPTTAERLSVDDSVTAPVLPKAGLDNPPLVLDVMPPDNRLVIPKIGKNVPIVNVNDRNLIRQDWKALEHDIQAGLMDGVVHYPGTAKPGTRGNFFVTGHSSFYAWTKSKYKDVFALLPHVEVGDRVTAYYGQRKYTYEIVEKKVVAPTDTTPLKATADSRITIMTCVPVGTDLNRLILVGKPVEE